MQTVPISALPTLRKLTALQTEVFISLVQEWSSSTGHTCYVFPSYDHNSAMHPIHAMKRLGIVKEVMRTFKEGLPHVALVLMINPEILPVAANQEAAVEAFKQLP